MRGPVLWGRKFLTFTAREHLQSPNGLAGTGSLLPYAA